MEQIVTPTLTAESRCQILTFTFIQFFSICKDVYQNSPQDPGTEHPHLGSLESEIQVCGEGRALSEVSSAGPTLLAGPSPTVSHQHAYDHHLKCRACLNVFSLFYFFFLQIVMPMIYDTHFSHSKHT